MEDMDRSELIQRLARRKKAAAMRRRERSEEEEETGVPTDERNLNEGDRTRSAMVRKANEERMKKRKERMKIRKTEY